MKYVKQVKAKLYFERGIPTKLRSVAGKANFSRPLKLDAATADEQQILEARIEAQRMYDLYLKTLENTSADAYADNEIEALAAEVLRRNRGAAGQYAPHMLGPKLQENDPDLAELSQVLTGQDYATLAVPEYLSQYLRWHQDGDLDEEGKLTRSLTAQEEAVIRAWEAVQKVAAKKPRTLYKCWDEYLIWRGVDVNTRAGKRSNGRWRKFAQHMPDVVLNEDTPNALEQALDAFQEAEISKGNKISSIQRDTNEFIACFRWTSKEYRLNWRPIKSKLSASKQMQNEATKQKQTLTRDEQSLLLTNTLEANTPLAAALLVLFQGGGMATEIARLRVEEDLWLDHEFPFIAFLGGWNRATKNEDRPRYIPVVFGLELIRNKLPEAIELLAKQSEPSQTLTQQLQKMLLPASKQRHFTSHCLRHTFRLNAQNVLANSMATMAIAGWSGEKTNKIAMQYGAEGFSHSESLRALHQEQRKIFAHLIKQEQEYKGVSANVLPFSGDKNK
jgi:integrase